MNINSTLESEFKEGVNYILEATNFESFCLWKDDEDVDNYTHGIGVHVGNIDDDKGKPVWISIGVSNYKGFKYLQYEATSRYVDYNMIDAWLSMHFKGVPKTNSMNIHLLKHAADKEVLSK